MSRHRITGAALVAGIAGKPVAHSLSPVIHNAWLAAGDIDGAYVPFAPADAAGFEALVAAGRAGLIQGLNVTAPFKEQAFALADQATAAARLTASANILTFDAGRVSADSSDGVGLMLGLKEQAPDLALKGRPVVLLGAGGAARAGAGAWSRRAPRFGSSTARATGPRPWRPISAPRSASWPCLRPWTAPPWSSTPSASSRISISTPSPPAR